MTTIDLIFPLFLQGSASMTGQGTLLLFTRSKIHSWKMQHADQDIIDRRL